ncbi:MAG: DUF2213 domain-containing protein [Lachnospiraceae bacterium]|nr:DUF2213 domain-containing protein [Lachnospiraceae bacterium]
MKKRRWEKLIQYYGYTISPNQIETGEGFLICRNVPIARTGDQEYLGREIGLDSNVPVTVRRPSEEVFSDAALASFEGKPVTDDHPPGLLDPDNVSMYAKGHAERVRKGTGEWEGYVIADLHIQDRSLIDAVWRGKREISCGYECEYVPNGDGTYAQKNIRGNHIAVVTRGRAGRRAAILDSDKKEEAERPERKTMKKNGVLLKLFGLSVKDKSPEEIERLALDTADVLEEGRKETVCGDKAQKEEAIQEPEKAKQETRDAAFYEELDKKLDKVLAALDMAGQQKKEESELDAAIQNLTDDADQAGETEEKENDDTAKVIPAEDAKLALDKAVAAAILKAMRPAVAAIGDEKARKAVADSLIACVTGKDSDGDIAKILKASQKNAKKAAGERQIMDNDAVQAGYDALNPHKRKETRE